MKVALYPIFCVLAVIIICFAAQSHGKEAPAVACSPDRPVVFPGETVRLRVWAEHGKEEKLTYNWEANAGKLLGSGKEAFWDFTDVEPGSHTASVYTAYPNGETQKCDVIILVEQREARGGITGWSLLPAGAKEKAGYGLYSYILFGSRPATADARERCLMVLEAYVSVNESIARLEAAGIAPNKLNITYVPVIKLLPQNKMPSPEWLLENYDYARARKILSSISGEYKSEGPYIISHLKPLSNIRQSPEMYLYQDLSMVMPKVIKGYAREFFNQAAQERHWEERTVRHLTLKLQNIIIVMAAGVGPVTEGIKDIKQIIKLKE
jgi:hypothetical protein